MPRRLLLTLLVAAACSRPPQGPPPRTEFLVANADSTFWVTSDGRAIKMRGAPLILARVGNRFQELYIADDDRSYYDAVFVGQRIYSRDLVRGDSTELLADGEVAALAEKFAKQHPDERPLGADEEGAEHPRTYAAADLHILGVVGPYASYEHLTNIDVAGGTSRHAAHRGVIDLRSGDEVTVGELFGDTAGARVEYEARDSWRAIRDSLQRSGGPDGAKAALEHFGFSAGSFVLDASERTPLVRFAIPGSGGRAGGLTLPVPPIPAPVPSWWKDVVESLPLGLAAHARWPRDRFELVARADTTSGERVTLALRDGTHEWPIGVVRGPVLRVYWLDAPQISRETRTALARAFDGASLYSEQARVVRAPGRPQAAGAATLASRETR